MMVSPSTPQLCPTSSASARRRSNASVPSAESASSVPDPSCPKRILSNADLEGMVGTSDEWIRTRTGMRERRIVSEGQAASDLALGAARAALTQCGLAAENVELIIVATFTPDTICPPTVCYVQERLGATRAAGVKALQSL